MIKVIWMACAAVALAAPAAAQGSAPKQKSSSPMATLYRVDEGLFELRAGEIVDLTDRKVTLHVLKQQDAAAVESQQAIRVQISGIRSEDITLRIGQRLNFQDRNGPARFFGLPDIMKDKTSCFLDFTNVSLPKGAAMIATFRFECN